MEDGEKAQIREIAFEVGETLMKRFNEVLKTKLEHHQLTCTAVTEVVRWKNQSKAIVVGVAIGAAIVGGGGVFGILKWLKFL